MLGLVLTCAGGIPLLSHAYSGNKPDVTHFPVMITAPADRHTALTTSASADADAAADMTVVLDAGQNSKANFALLAEHQPVDPAPPGPGEAISLWRRGDDAVACRWDRGAALIWRWVCQVGRVRRRRAGLPDGASASGACRQAGRGWPRHSGPLLLVGGGCPVRVLWMVVCDVWVRMSVSDTSAMRRAQTRAGLVCQASAS